MHWTHKHAWNKYGQYLPSCSAHLICWVCSAKIPLKCYVLKPGSESRCYCKSCSASSFWNYYTYQLQRGKAHSNTVWNTFRVQIWSQGNQQEPVTVPQTPSLKGETAHSVINRCSKHNLCVVTSLFMTSGLQGSHRSLGFAWTLFFICPDWKSELRHPSGQQRRWDCRAQGFYSAFTRKKIVVQYQHEKQHS